MGNWFEIEIPVDDSRRNALIDDCRTEVCEVERLIFVSAHYVESLMNDYCLDLNQLVPLSSFFFKNEALFDSVYIGLCSENDILSQKPVVEYVIKRVRRKIDLLNDDEFAASRIYDIFRDAVLSTGYELLERVNSFLFDVTLGA